MREKKNFVLTQQYFIGMTSHCIILFYKSFNFTQNTLHINYQSPGLQNIQQTYHRFLLEQIFLYHLNKLPPVKKKCICRS